MSLDAKIRERLTELDKGYGAVGGTARAALRAVLAVHQPKDDVSYFGDTRLRCTVCQRRGLPPQWPCDTVQAIATAMGVTP